jgi:hypothetical protein
MEGRYKMGSTPLKRIAQEGVGRILGPNSPDKEPDSTYTPRRKEIYRVLRGTNRWSTPGCLWTANIVRLCIVVRARTYDHARRSLIGLRLWGEPQLTASPRGCASPIFENYLFGGKRRKWQSNPSAVDLQKCVFRCVLIN